MTKRGGEGEGWYMNECMTINRSAGKAKTKMEEID